MSNITLLIQEVLLKYKSLDANKIHERNQLINDEKLHNELCDLVKTLLENEKVVERKKTQEHNVNIKSFLSAALGALVVNIAYNYYNF